MGIWNEAQEIPARLSRKSYTIASNDSIGACFLPPVLHLLIRKNPDVDIRLLSLHSVEAYLYMERGLADIAFISDARYSKDIDTVNLTGEKFVVLSDANLNLSAEVSAAELDPAKEIYMEWTPGFDRWHRYWFRTPPASCAGGFYLVPQLSAVSGNVLGCSTAFRSGFYSPPCAADMFPADPAATGPGLLLPDKAPASAHG